MKNIAALAVMLIGQLSFCNTRGTYTVLTIDEAADLGLVLTVDNPNKLFQDIVSAPISFSLDTESFDNCEIDFVSFNAYDSTGTDIFASIVGQRLQKYEFSAQAEYLERSVLTIECKTDEIGEDPEHYSLNLGQIILAP